MTQTSLPLMEGSAVWLRTPTRRSYLMVRPSHFDVRYAINPWMRLDIPVDSALAMRQWEVLKATYLRLGHLVHVIEGGPGLPDMVFAANGGLVVDGRAMGARFLHAERTGEEALFDAAFDALGLSVLRPDAVNEGEGDFLTGPHEIFAGTGFRTDPRAHLEVAAAFGREVVTVELVDPRFYHLDTCMAVLDERTAVVFPGAFSPTALGRIRDRFDEVIEAAEADAVVLGLNIVSDGRHVVLEASATGLAAELAGRGFVPIGVDMSEFRKSGGAVKCATLELRHG